MRSLLIRWAIIAVAFAVTAKLLGGMSVNGGFFAYVWVSLIFGLVNVFIGTILRIVTLPLTLLTFGLFLIVVNAILLSITDWLTNDLTIDDFFWTAIWAAIILGLTTMILEYAFRGLEKR
ncbi:MAG: phage holin family protein [Gaiellaceae bacterium]